VAADDILLSNSHGWRQGIPTILFDIKAGRGMLTFDMSAEGGPFAYRNSSSKIVQVPSAFKTFLQIVTLPSGLIVWVDYVELPQCDAPCHHSIDNIGKNELQPRKSTRRQQI
jgi:hypothetical protein